jgi:hypothetical protein
MTIDSSPHVPDLLVMREAEVASWARLLDEHPAEIQRAMKQAGADLGAIRRYLFSRQMGLDFSSAPADVSPSVSRPWTG